MLGPRYLRKVGVLSLGRVAYDRAWALQEALCHDLVEQKIAARKGQYSPLARQHYLLFCEHFPVITMGRSAKEAHLHADKATLAASGIALHEVNRGGDITYHGPGQLVVYPILDLDCFFHDIHRLLRSLEEATIRVLRTYGVPSGRLSAYTGVWVPAGDRHNKVAAIGLRCSHWVSMHGLALNVQTDISAFDRITPCGISTASYGVTSLHEIMGREVPMEEVQDRFLGALCAELDMDVFSHYPNKDMETWLQTYHAA